MQLFTGHSRKLAVDIIPDSPFVVIEGAANEGADPAKLTGLVELRVQRPVRVRRVRLILRAVEKIVIAGLDSSKRTVHQQSVALVGDDIPADSDHDSHHEHDQASSPSSTTLDRGPHSFPFEFVIPADAPESIEGMHLDETAPRHGFVQVVYRLDAIVDRPFAGTTASHTVGTSHIRLVRTLRRPDQSADGLSVGSEPGPVHTSIWRGKASYRVEFPRSRIVFGAAVGANLAITPLSKGISVGKAVMEVREKVTAQLSGRTYAWEQTIGKTEVSAEQVAAASAAADREVADREAAAADGAEPGQERQVTPTEDDAIRLSVAVPLPQSLARCRQSVSMGRKVRISHYARLMVDILNPDGHISQLAVRAAVQIYISPVARFLDDQRVEPVSVISPSTFPGAATAHAHGLFWPDEPPPEYGRHQLDRLFDDIDPAGMATPAVGYGAGGSPLAGLTANHSAEHLPDQQAIGADALVSRLRRLDRSSVPSASTTNEDQDDQHAQETNGQDGTDNVSQPIHRLVKIPSYNTAVQAVLPSYAAISTRSSMGELSGVSSSPPIPTTLNRTVRSTTINETQTSRPINLRRSFSASAIPEIRTGFRIGQDQDVNERHQHNWHWNWNWHWPGREDGHWHWHGHGSNGVHVEINAGRSDRINHDGLGQSRYSRDGTGGTGHVLSTVASRLRGLV